MNLSRANIIAIKPRTLEVALEGEQDTVLVRELTAAENETYGKSMLNAEGRADLTVVQDLDVMLVVMGCITDDGEQMFSSEDIDDLRRLPHRVTRAIADGVREVTGIKKKPSPDPEGSAKNGAFSIG